MSKIGQAELRVVLPSTPLSAVSDVPTGSSSRPPTPKSALWALRRFLLVRVRTRFERATRGSRRRRQAADCDDSNLRVIRMFVQSNRTRENNRSSRSIIQLQRLPHFFVRYPSPREYRCTVIEDWPYTPVEARLRLMLDLEVQPGNWTSASQQAGS
jgi:hypothetical protein